MERFFEDFEFIYHPIFQSEYTLEDICSQDIECDILLLEGSFSESLQKGDIKAQEIIEKYAKKVKKIVTVGTCATFGGIFAQSKQQKASGFHFQEERRLERFSAYYEKSVAVSGCPIQPEVLANTLYAIKDELVLRLDTYGRPKEYFAFTIHNGCTRNEYFEYKIDNHKFGTLEGCMFYEHGCNGPFTKGSCNKILWNEVNSKTRAGVPCFGCMEPTFPKENFFNTKKNMGIPDQLPIGVPKRTYLALAGVAKAFKIERFEKKILDD